MPKLEQWARGDVAEPLTCLSIGLLGLAMESSDIAGEHKNINYQLVPTIIKKLQYLTLLIHETNSQSTFSRTDAYYSQSNSRAYKNRL